jgi:hypothetical protein
LPAGDDVLFGVGGQTGFPGFLGPVLAQYHGPLLSEMFNAVPPFVNGLRLTRPKFWIPGEDAPVRGVPDAYTIAAEGLAAVRDELAKRAQRTGRTPSTAHGQLEGKTA